MPIVRVVERNGPPSLGSSIKQPPPNRVFTYHTCKVVLRNACSNLCPGCPVIVGLVKVGLEVVPLVAGRSNIGSRGIVRRRLDDVDERPLGQFSGRYVPPDLPAILRDVHQAIIGTSPEQPALEWRFIKSQDGA